MPRERHVRFGSKADICSAKAHVRFTPKSGHLSALGQKRTFHHSFDHLVGARDEPRRHGEAERLGRLEVDHQLELGRLLDW